MVHSALLMGSLKLGFGVQLTPGTQAGIFEASKVNNPIKIFAANFTD